MGFFGTSTVWNNFDLFDLSGGMVNFYASRLQCHVYIYISIKLVYKIRDPLFLINNYKIIHTLRNVPRICHLIAWTLKTGLHTRVDMIEYNNECDDLLEKFGPGGRTLLLSTEL